MIVETLQVGQEVTRAAQGTFLRVRFADGPLLITAVLLDGRSTSYDDVEAGDQIELIGEIRELRISNAHSGPNNFDIATSYGLYHKRQDGQAVSIAGQAAPLEVELSGAVAVENDNTNPLHVINEYEQWVVTDPGQPLHVVHQAPAGAVVALPEITPDTTGATVAANAARRVLVLRAGPGNTGVIWLGAAVGQGIPLAAGDDPLKLETTGALPVVAENATDTLHVLELQ